MRRTLAAGACLLLVAACGSGERRAGTPTAGSPAARAGPAVKTGPCQPAPVHDRAPPAFTDIPDVPPMPHPYTVSADGEVVAFLFVHPMRVTRPGGPNNKVLWVVGRRAEAKPLLITARGPGRTVRSRGDVPMFASGQIQRSILRFPKPGCWRLDLQYGTRRTTLDVQVEPV